MYVYYFQISLAMVFIIKLLEKSKWIKRLFYDSYDDKSEKGVKNI